MKTNTKEWI
jgi:hypothetical protein